MYRSPLKLKKFLSVILTLCLVSGIFACIPGLSAYAVDNTPVSESNEEITEDAENNSVEILPEGNTVQNPARHSPFKTTTTSAEPKNAIGGQYTSGLYTYFIDTYYVSSGEAYILKCDTSATGGIVIPSTLGGCPVTYIDSYAFSNCVNITSLTIPDSVETINYLAFSGCTGLESITIGKNVTYIDWGIIENCAVLDNIYIDPLNSTYYSSGNCIIEKSGKKLIAGCNSSIIPLNEGITSIGDEAFSGCAGLKSITLPDTIKSSGKGAFYGCTGIEKVNYTGSASDWCKIEWQFLSNPIEYSRNLYINDQLLTELIIDSSVTSINQYAFGYCSSIKSITLPNTITSIGNNAFINCKFERVNYNGNATDWCRISFEHVSSNPIAYTKEFYINGQLATDLIIDDSITEIKKYAFYNCTFIKNVTLPDTIISIGEYAFYRCYSMNNIVLPSGLVYIGDWAFYACNGFTSVEIPDGVLSIGRGAFNNCNGITSIEIPESVTNIGVNSFGSCSHLNEITVNSKTTVIENEAIPKKVNIICYKNSTADKYAQANGNNVEYFPCLHTFGDWETKTEPTCNEKGERQRVCSECEYTETEEIDQLGHNWQDEWSKDAKCHWKDCSRCDKTADEERHFFTLSAGVYKCKVCGFEVNQYSGAYAVVKGHKVNAGDTAVVIVELHNAPRVTSMAAENLTFDSSVLMLQSIEWIYEDAVSSSWDDVNNKGTALIGTETNISDSVLSVKFSVDELAPEGAYAVNIDFLISSGGNIYYIPVISGDTEVHSFAEIVDEKYLKSPADCENKAVYYKSCTVCGEISEETFEYGELTEHTFVNRAINTYVLSWADCTHSSVYYKSCSACGKRSDETFVYGAPLGHNIDEEWTFNTSEHWKVCKRCGEQFELETHVFIWVILTEPTCTENGEAQHICAKCGYTDITRPVAALDHDYLFVENISPTCTQYGYTVYKCSRCNKTKYSDYVSATGHKYIDAVSDKYLASAADCTNPDVYYKSCSICGSRSDETFTSGNALGHYWNAIKSYDDTRHWFECSRCEEKTQVDRHTFGAWNRTVEPTCTSVGREYRGCSLCLYVEWRDVEKRPHNYIETVSDEYLFNAATCTENSVYCKSCSECGAKGEETFEFGEPLGHIWQTEWSKNYSGHWHKCGRCEIKNDYENHCYGNWETIIEPTCTEKGIKQKKCSICEYIIEEDVEEKEHYYSIVTTEPTCTVNGQTVKTCLNCGRVETTPINALGHNYSVKVTNPTCTEQGYTTHTCLRCGDVFIDSITNANGHTFKEIERTTCLVSEADCTHPAVYYKSCLVCGEVSDIMFEYGSPLGHNYGDSWSFDFDYHWQRCCRCNQNSEVSAHVYGDWVYTIEPTCIGDGLEQRTCRICGRYQEQTAKKLGHDYSVITVVQSSCTEMGYTLHSCIRCSDSFKTDFTDLISHSFVVNPASIYLKTSPDCENAGVYYKSCSVCGAKSDETFVWGNPLGHSWETEWECNGLTHWQKCSRCSGTRNNSAHVYGAWTVTVEPDCTLTGEKHRFCAVCNYEDKEAVEELGHNYKTAVTEPTCTNSGYTTYTCTRCNHIEKRDIVPALGHNWSAIWVTTETEHWRVCTRCQDKKNIGEHIYGEWMVTLQPTQTDKGEHKHLCTICGYEEYEELPALQKPGDVNNDGIVNDQDAVYLLFYTFFPETYPVTQDCDFNNDGKTDDQDAVYLLFYTFFPNSYPIN